MKKYILAFMAMTTLFFSSCDEGVLERPQLTKFTDTNFWRNESDLRLYCNEFYPQYFTGYGSGFSTPWVMLRGYAFDDNVVSSGKQPSFPSSLPGDLGSTKLQGADWRTQWQGQMWNYAWIRKCNIMLDRMESKSKSLLSDEAYKHWTAVARLFRAWEYHRLVITFGDVPYFEHELSDTDFATLYKDRTPRKEVMQHVYDDLKYAIANIRENDGHLFANRAVAAAVASRIMLFEGTWQKYHNLDQDFAKKCLDFCVEASEIVMNTGDYSCSKPFRTLFGSDDLSGHPGVIMYRHYADGETTHCIASYSNGEESGKACNLNLIKSFICNDGKAYQNSTVADAQRFDVPTLAKTRDPRFEATFFNFAHNRSSSMLYADKFISREGANYLREDNLASLPSKFKSSTNYNDAPCLRYAEVLLNWIEAKAVLAEFYSGAAVTQADLDRSVNALRDRPLDETALAIGVQKTAHLQLAALPNDPARDADVSALIWEIRRERRMEFIFESSRLHDIRRWKKINYMNCDTHPDNLFGPWIDFPNEMPAYVAPNSDKVGLLQVRHADGTIVTFDGTNADQMVGYYHVEKATNRNAFGDEVYISPIGKSQITEYDEKGYTLTQTPGWEGFN